MTDVSDNELKEIQTYMKYVVRHFKQNGLRLDVYDECTLNISMGGFTNLPQLHIALVFDSAPSVQCRTLWFSQANDDKYADVLNVINELNREYRFIKISMDPSDGEIICEYDFHINPETVGDDAFRVVATISLLCDTVYPRIMKKLWGE